MKTVGRGKSRFFIHRHLAAFGSNTDVVLCRRLGNPQCKVGRSSADPGQVRLSSYAPDASAMPAARLRWLLYRRQTGWFEGNINTDALSRRSAATVESDIKALKVDAH